MVTSDLAQDLCESLRLILEPSQASRLKVKIEYNFILVYLFDFNLILYLGRLPNWQAT